MKISHQHIILYARCLKLALFMRSFSRSSPPHKIKPEYTKFTSKFTCAVTSPHIKWFNLGSIGFHMLHLPVLSCV